MPLYAFRCENCGEFDAWRRLAEFDQAMNCPTCQALVQRLFAPSRTIISLSSSKLRAIGRQSSEPRVVKRDRPLASPRCQSASSARPWMVSHTSQRL